VGPATKSEKRIIGAGPVTPPPLPIEKIKGKPLLAKAMGISKTEAVNAQNTDGEGIGIACRAPRGESISEIKLIVIPPQRNRIYWAFRVWPVNVKKWLCVRNGENGKVWKLRMAVITKAIRDSRVWLV
jgi:hypothetical protein